MTSVVSHHTTFLGEIGERVSSAGAVVSCLRHTHGRRMPSHSHAAAYFSLLLRGGYREENGRNTIESTPMTMVFHPPETRHRDEVGPDGGVFLTIELPSVAQTFVSARRIDDTAAKLSALRLYHQMRTGSADPLSVENTVTALIGSLHEEERSPLDASWLTTAVEIIRTSFHEPLSISGIAAEVGVHPVHLSRVYRRRFGELPGDTIRRLRIEWAARVMAADGGRSLADIALAAGFSDQSHFTRCYRAETGAPPAASRRAFWNDER